MVPMEIGNLVDLTNRWLKNNMLDGDLPSSLDNLTNLERVRISGNNFDADACLPASLAAVTDNDYDLIDPALPTCGSGDGS